jgi:hypothetical protein
LPGTKPLRDDPATRLRRHECQDDAARSCHRVKITREVDSAVEGCTIVLSRQSQQQELALSAENGPTMVRENLKSASICDDHWSNADVECCCPTPKLSCGAVRVQ